MKSASRSAFLIAVVVVACRDEPAPIAAEHRRESPTKCATCHLPEFETTKHPPHVDARPTTCGVCHTQTSWSHWRVEHPFWELTGAHARAAADKELAGKENQVKCFWCHRGDPATWKDTKKECVACHEEDKSTSRFPDHDTFADTCQDCHSTEKWKPAKKPPRAPDVAPVDAPVDAGAPEPKPSATVTPKPKPKPVTPKPTATPTSKPPDVITRPSRRR